MSGKENYYANHGQIIQDVRRYVKRSKIEQELLNRTLKDVHGSTNLVGMPRTGKSSIIYQTYLKNKNEYFAQNKIIIINLSMNEFDDAKQFFLRIAQLIMKFLKERQIDDDYLNSIYSMMPDSSDIYFELQMLLEAVRSDIGRIVCIIDEFDYSQRLFKDYPSGFNKLRELAYQPETDVTFVFVSRRLVRELVDSVGLTSPLVNILGSPIYVTPFDEVEFQEYLDKAADFGLELSDADRTNLMTITGKIPYLLDLLMYEYCNYDGKMKIKEIYEMKKGTLLEEFNHLSNLLQDQDLLKTLFMLLAKTEDNLDRAKLKTLTNYGLIIDDKQQYHFFSKEYQRYLYLKKQMMQFDELWKITERKLRNLMAMILKEIYGQDWEKKILERYSSLLKEANKTKDRMQRDFIMDNSMYDFQVDFSIVDSTNTSTLFQLYANEYDFFEPIFKVSYDEFIRITDDIVKTRNRFAHNNEEVLDPNFIDKVKNEVINLLDRINDYLKYPDNYPSVKDILYNKLVNL